MILDLDKLIAAHPEHLWLELSPELRERTWEQLGNYANDAARWRAYVNDLCLNAFVNWLQHEADLADALLVSPGRSALPSIWEFVTGSRVELGETRLVLIPSEIYDIEEICVPQEWVDIPSWAGDYYLGVQVQLEGDECWMRVWGVTTHSKVKQGNYDRIERTYTVEKEELAGSINALWLSREICPPPKPDVAMLPALDAAEVAGLLQELGQIRSYSPRLELPFTKWAALLHNDGDRLQLYRRRLVPPLSQWFDMEQLPAVQAIRASGWQLYREVFGAVEVVALARRFRKTESEPAISWVKRIDGEIFPSKYGIALVMNLMRDQDGIIWILPQVRTLGAIERSVCLPEGLQLKVVDESGTTFDEVIAGRASNMIQLDDWFNDYADSRLTIEIVYQDTTVRESFVI